MRFWCSCLSALANAKVLRITFNRSQCDPEAKKTPVWGRVQSIHEVRLVPKPAAALSALELRRGLRGLSGDPEDTLAQPLSRVLEAKARRQGLAMWEAEGHLLLTTVPILCGPMGRDNTLRNNLEAKTMLPGVESGSSPLTLQIKPK